MRTTAPLGIVATGLQRLRSPDSGAVGQGVRYAAVGGVVAIVYLTTTTMMAEIFSVPFQFALVVGFVTAVILHFTLQRLLVWVHHAPFALSVREQVGRYLLVVTAQYLFTAASTSLLPGALGVSVLPIYLATTLALAATNFLVFRGRVFHVEG
jgi:putative flippase GtrA